ncbi:MAG: carboxypeptidase-like regulatory domain-containing protein [Bacteroidales bacterium]
MIKRIISISTLLILFTTCYAQDQVLNRVITYKTKEIKLYDALNEISDIVGYEFSYNADLVAANKNIKANFKDEKLKDILDDILNDSTLKYRVVEKQIVIYKRNPINSIASIHPNLSDSATQITITGLIVDNETGEPLPYANISIFGKSIGTISNEEGDFVFKFPAKFLESNLVVSFIGYKNATIPVAELSHDENIIYLNRDMISLQEVVIRYVDPISLIREAIDKIPENYSTQDNIYTVFYREIIKRNDEYAAVSEAVLNVFKSPYNNYHNDHIRLLKSRKNIDQNVMDTLFFKLKGGLRACLYLDIIKNRTSFIDEDKFHLYEYEMINIVNIDNSRAYVVEFSPKFYIQDDSFKGKLFIDTETHAIKAAEFEIDPSAISKLSQELVVKKTWKTKVKPVSANYRVNYRMLDSILHLNMVRGELDFKVRNKNRLFSDDYKTIFEFAVNDIDTSNVDRFKRSEMINTEKIFIDQHETYDASFWGDYNFIKPDEPLEDALVRIAKSLEKLNGD